MVRVLGKETEAINAVVENSSGKKI